MNKEDIIAILMSNLRPMKETRLAVLEQIADEIIELVEDEYGGYKDFHEQNYPQEL